MKQKNNNGKALHTLKTRSLADYNEQFGKSGTYLRRKESEEIQLSFFVSTFPLLRLPQAANAKVVALLIGLFCSCFVMVGQQEHAHETLDLLDSIPPVLTDSMLSVPADSMLSVAADSMLSVAADSVLSVAADSVLLPVKQEAIAENIVRNFTLRQNPFQPGIDSTKQMYYWRITPITGEIVAGQPDTAVTNFFNRSVADGYSIAMGHLANLGLPVQSHIHFDRPDRSNFMFSDPYYIYTKAPDRFNFISTKIPFSNLTYQSAGSRVTKEERMLGALSLNVGKKLNVGLDLDYLYARGYYQSQSAKHLDWAVYSSYITDRSQLHVLINPFDYTNMENGGIINDYDIIDPESSKATSPDRPLKSNEMPVKYINTWNRFKGTHYFLNYHYYLGFERDTGKKDEEGEEIRQFVPVSSIIYTFDYEEKKRRFNSRDSIGVDSVYYQRDMLSRNQAVNDSTSYWNLSNTFGLSLREGFSSWAKFDLTVFVKQDFRNYTLMDTISVNKEWRQSSTYIGGELAKRGGKILRYNAEALFGVLGDNLGDMILAGMVETRIPVFKDTASLIGRAHVKNIEPAFYEKHFRGKYFWWDHEEFSKIKKVYIGGELNIPHTKTNIKAGVENLTNYIYFDRMGDVQQYTGNIQILGITWEQNMRLGILHWDNQAVYQTSSNQELLPVPDFCIHSNLYIDFLVAKVLRIQMGGNMHYFTKYYASTYDPATQQFRLQNELKVGDYPLITGYVNCHLKYTRFFVEFYNISASFIPKPEYFSLPHYPYNPQIFKFGLSWNFYN